VVYAPCIEAVGACVMAPARRRAGEGHGHRRLKGTGTTKLLRAQRCYSLKTPLEGVKMEGA
jgi:hypothetical protein